MTHRSNANTDRLHVDVLLADHYPNHDRSCPDHHYHQDRRDDHEDDADG